MLPIRSASTSSAYKQWSTSFACGDTYMLGGYGAVNVDLGRTAFQVSGANYSWTNVDSIARATAILAPITAILTNEVVKDADGVVTGYASKFNVVDVIGEASFRFGERNYPVRLLAEYSRNTRAANDRDSGFWTEAEFGSARDAGSFRSVLHLRVDPARRDAVGVRLQRHAWDQPAPAHDQHLVDAAAKPQLGRDDSHLQAAAPRDWPKPELARSTPISRSWCVSNVRCTCAWRFERLVGRFGATSASERPSTGLSRNPRRP